MNLNFICIYVKKGGQSSFLTPSLSFPSFVNIIFSLSNQISTVNTYTIDKSGPVFVAGMNDVQKILDKSGDWSDTKCSDQTRYAILSAVNKAKNLKCNFTFGTGVAVRNTDVINTLFAAQPVGMFDWLISKQKWFEYF